MLLLKCALKKTSKKPSPTRVPLTGPRVEKQDYYSVHLTRNVAPSPDLWVRRAGKRGVACKQLVVDKNVSTLGRYSKNIFVPWKGLKNVKIEITHHLKGNVFRYNTARAFLVQQFFFLPYISIFKGWLSQALYNSRTPIRSSRVNLLQRLVCRRIRCLAENNRYIIQDERGDSVLDLLRDIYGDRIDSHPKSAEYRSNLLVDLDSLVATGDVKKTHHNFVATGKAVATIAAYEEENRRHIDNKKHNRRILLLTAILAIIGGLQIPYVQNFLGIGAPK